MSEHPKGPPPRRADHQHPYAKKIGVKFNGAVIFDALAYDADAGWVSRQIKDARGKVKMERGQPVSLTFHGTVEPYWR